MMMMTISFTIISMLTVADSDLPFCRDASQQPEASPLQLGFRHYFLSSDF